MAEFDFESAFTDDQAIVARSESVSEKVKVLGTEKATSGFDFESAFGESAEAQPEEKEPKATEIDKSNEKIDAEDDQQKANDEALSPESIQRIETSDSIERFFEEQVLPDGVEESFLKKALSGRMFSNTDWSKVKKSLAQKLEGENLLKALATPTGQHYVELGKNMPFAENILEAAGMGKVVPLDPKVKYGPMIAQNLEMISRATGVDTTHLPDRFVVGAFLDTVMTGSFSRVLSKMAVKGALKTTTVAELEGHIAKWIKSDPNTLREFERTLAKMELTAAKSSSQGWSAATKTETNKMLQAVADGATEMAKNDTKAVVFKGVKYLKVNNEWKAFKLTEGIEKTAHTKEIMKELSTIRGTAPMPKLGEDDINMFGKARKAFTQAIASPQHVVPELYDLNRQKVKWMHMFKQKYVDRLAPLAHIQKDGKKSKKIADFLNGDLKLEDANFTPEDLKAVNAFRQSWDELADVMYEATKDPKLAPNRRIKDYYTHVAETIHSKLKQPNQMGSFALDDVKAGLNEMRNPSKGFLKKREGNKDFSRNPFKAFEVYMNWASEFMADQRIMPIWEKVKSKLPAHAADYGTWYWNNIHGSQSQTKLVRKAEKYIRNGVYKAVLGWNAGAAMVNRTQPYVLGALRLGTDNPLFAGAPNFGPIVKGQKLLNLAQKNTKEGRHIREVLRSSTVLDEMSEFLTDEKLLAGAKDTKIFKQSLGAVIKDPMLMFQRSEAVNKATMYLGVYDDILTKIDRVKTLGIEKSKNTFIYLSKLGIDVTKEGTEQAHKRALKFTLDTQLDMSKSGQSQLASYPVVGSMMMLTSYPIKATEMLAKTVGPAIKKMGRAVMRKDASVLLDADVQGTMRFAGLSAITAVMADAAGVDAGSIIGLSNYVPNLSPIAKMSIRSMNSLLALVDNVTAISKGEDIDVFAPGFAKESYLGARGAKHAMRDLSYAMGIPGAAQAWKLAGFFKIVHDNWDVKRKDGLWDVFDDKGTLMYRTKPEQALLGLFLPSKDKMGYYDAVRISMAKDAARKNLSNKWLKAKRANQLDRQQELAGKLREEYGIRPRETTTQRKARHTTFEEREAKRNRRRDNAGK